MSIQPRLVEIVVSDVYTISHRNWPHTELHVMILGLHEMDVSFVKSSPMSVCWPETPKNIAIVQSRVVDRLHLCELVE